MDTSKLKKFAQFARALREQISAKFRPGARQRKRSPARTSRVGQSARGSHQAKPVKNRSSSVALHLFNCFFCALRFMDINRYTVHRGGSPAEGQFQPEILAEAKMGHIDEDMVPSKTRQQIADLLAGRAPSHDPQRRGLPPAGGRRLQCRHQSMPFLFERIEDYTELLMPDDLLSATPSSPTPARR